MSSGGTTFNIPVTMTISQLSQAILLSQSGLSFVGVSNGGVIPPQTFGVVNIGTGVVNWRVSTSTLSGGSDWLHVDTASGSTDAQASTVPSVAVTTNPAALPPGKYYGQVRVDAPGAANSPQVLTVFLQVLPPGTDIGAVADPAQLLFTAPGGGSSPSSQELNVYNVAATPKSFRSLVAGGGVNLVVSPTDGTLDPQNPSHIVVQPFTDGVAAGVYTGTVTLQFSDGRVRATKVTTVVAGTSSSSTSTTAANAHAGPRDSAVCQPARLVTALSSLGQAFEVSAGWPVALVVDVKDDCGNPLESGSVNVSFSSGDTPLSLLPVKAGHWEGTWKTRGNALSQVTLHIHAQDTTQQLQGDTQVDGALEAPTDPPVFTKDGVLSAAAGQSFAALAPGSIISIYGERLSQSPVGATDTPLPNILAQTNVFMAGEPLPLYYVSPTQINAQVPFDINVNTTQQILVQNGPTYSQPVSVDVAPAQPSIFVDSSVAPKQGIVYVVRGTGASQSQFEATPSTPAHVGDVVVIYCAGLGIVNPAVASGAAAMGVSSATNPVQVSIGNQTAPVLFAGLTPGFVGLYQVNATVPADVSGSAVPIAISVAGQTSPIAVMAVQ
ncbi:MAG TPA: hypothetical protein VKX49_06770 [Bryobacteraceae bacterium]|nr:hypothetical protein [Bryobacteraceae bacterium]